MSELSRVETSKVARQRLDVHHAEVRLCKCHGEPMGWNKDGRRGSGGFWYCRIKTRLYHASEKGRAAAQRYRDSEHGKAKIYEYNHSEKGLALKWEYAQTPHARLMTYLRNVGRVRIDY